MLILIPLNFFLKGPIKMMYFHQHVKYHVSSKDLVCHLNDGIRSANVIRNHRLSVTPEQKGGVVF